jgi:hypothetical protein
VSDKPPLPNFTAEYATEATWAVEHGVSQRTVSRHRGKGLPWLEWAGKIWIPRREGQEYIASRVKGRRSPPRRRKPP